MLAINKISNPSSPLNTRRSIASSAIFLFGFALVVFLPAWIHWGELMPWREDFPHHRQFIISTIISCGAYSISFFLIDKFKHFPNTHALSLAFPIIITSWVFSSIILTILHENNYSRKLLLYSLLITITWVLFDYYLTRRTTKTRLAIIPFGRATALIEASSDSLTIQESANISLDNFDAIAVDLHASDMPAKWQQILTKSALMGIPIFSVQQIIENKTGRIQVDHLSENFFSPNFSRFYTNLKTPLEISTIIITAPIWLAILLITSFFITIESAGPIFYTQNRIGKGGRIFRIYKLRSMFIDSEKNGPKFASKNDARVTRVGKFIRKTRIDEIPQFFNILKGEMSLIGPRPEQPEFVQRFSEEIPFYSYRHIVKPGITGWAQVVHGYAADTKDTKVKMEYDFYYIKNFSLWIDLLIIAKTLRTILTGFGAR